MINARAETRGRRSRPTGGRSPRSGASSRPTASTSGRRAGPPRTPKARPKKQPYFIHRLDGEPLAFAGLWEVWKVPDEPRASTESAWADGWLRSCVIVTTAPNDLHGADPRPHAGDPARVRVGAVARPGRARRRRAGEAARPRAGELIEAYPGEHAVNNARNNGPELARRRSTCSTCATVEPTIAHRRDPDRERRAGRGRASRRARRARALVSRLDASPTCSCAHRHGAALGRRDRSSGAPANPLPAGSDRPTDRRRVARVGASGAAAQLVAALRATPPDTAAVDVLRSGRGSVLVRVARRTRSRCTVSTRELAAGTLQPIDSDLACDGIDEFFEVIAPFRLRDRLVGERRDVPLPSHRRRRRMARPSHPDRSRDRACAREGRRRGARRRVRAVARAARSRRASKRSRCSATRPCSTRWHDLAAI